VAAGFIVTRLVLVDMFPQTFHIEAVVRLDRG
jgi:tRNA/tmRNA/rRNA uracil-C5-methylase (TrmA/RlmC/RlmD family)